MFEFRTKPYKHQKEEFDAHKETAARAIFWEQGTGKTKITIDTVSYLFGQNKVDALLVVAPGGVHLNWITDELPKHLPLGLLAKTEAVAYNSKKASTKRHREAVKAVVMSKGLAVLAITFDAFTTKAGKQAVSDFLQYRKVFYVVDESSRIKTPGAKRTKSIVLSGKYAPYRRILNGTPISNAPFDVFSQIKFLDKAFWKDHGLGSFTVFKNYFGKFERVHLKDGTQFNKLLGYRNLDELSALVKSISIRVTKEEVLDLPPKVYTKRYHQMTPKQEHLYKNIKNDMMSIIEAADGCENCVEGKVEYEGVLGECPTCEGTGKSTIGVVITPLAIVQMLRLQQIICGYIPVEVFGTEEGEDDLIEELVLMDVDDTNPRLDLLEEIVADIKHPFIVFSRFRRDVELIAQRLKKLGITSVRYDGSMDQDERAAAKQAFQEDGTAQCFNAITSVAAEGLTLTAAKTVIYYSNDFMLAKRLQSEDRAHRIGQENKVEYIDMVCANTIDEHIVKALMEKFDIAKQINGDTLKEWIKNE